MDREEKIAYMFPRVQAFVARIEAMSVEERQAAKEAKRQEVEALAADAQGGDEAAQAELRQFCCASKALKRAIGGLVRAAQSEEVELPTEAQDVADSLMALRPEDQDVES